MKFNEIFRKYMIILKVTKSQSFIFSLKSTSFLSNIFLMALEEDIY